MANTIGNTALGGFQDSITTDKVVFASKFTAGASFTPTNFNVAFSDAWGQSGTMYCAIYSDNAGVPGTKLWSGSITYPSLHDDWLGPLNMSSPPSLVNGTNYWLCVYPIKDAGGVLNLQFNIRNSSNDLKTWTETGSGGTWTDNPTSSTHQASKELSIYAADFIAVTKTHTTNALKKKIDNTKTHTSNALLKKAATKTHTSDAYLRAIVGIPTWVSPSNHASGVQGSDPLVFVMPTAEANIHFELQIDTANTFNSGNLQIKKSWENQTGWEYWNGSAWVAIPSGGVPNTYSGNQARYTPPVALSATTYYRRIRGRVVLE